MQTDYDFEKLSIDCVPLTELIYKTGSIKVHQILHGSVQGENSDTRIKPKESKKYGRLDYLALLAQYGGKGNNTVQIKEAEALWTLLIYKNERAM